MLDGLDGTCQFSKRLRHPVAEGARGQRGRDRDPDTYRNQYAQQLPRGRNNDCATKRNQQDPGRTRNIGGCPDHRFPIPAQEFPTTGMTEIDLRRAHNTAQVRPYRTRLVSNEDNRLVPDHLIDDV